MASPLVNTNFGGTVAFGTSTAMNSLQLIDLEWSGGERAAIDVTHYGSGAEGANEIGNADHILTDVGDPGSLEITYHFNPDTKIPLAGAAETITVTYKGGATWVFSGGIVAASGAMPMRDKMVMSVTVKILGPITRTAAP